MDVFTESYKEMQSEAKLGNLSRLANDIMKVAMDITSRTKDPEDVADVFNHGLALVAKKLGVTPKEFFKMIGGFPPYSARNQ